MASAQEWQTDQDPAIVRALRFVFSLLASKVAAAISFIQEMHPVDLAVAILLVVLAIAACYMWPAILPFLTSMCTTAIASFVSFAWNCIRSLASPSQFIAALQSSPSSIGPMVGLMYLWWRFHKWRLHLIAFVTTCVVFTVISRLRSST